MTAVTFPLCPPGLQSWTKYWMETLDAPPPAPQIKDGKVVSRIERNGNILILLIPIPLRLWRRLRLRFLIFTRS